MTEKFVLVNLKGKKAKRLAEAISNDTCREILDYLSEKEEASASDISKDLSIPISTVNYNIKSLMDNKLIESKEFKWSPKGREMNLFKLARKFIIISPGKFEGLGDKLKTILPIVFVLALVSFGYMFFSSDKVQVGEESLIKEFSSVDELYNYLRSVGAHSRYSEPVMGTTGVSGASSGGVTSSGGSISFMQPEATDYSTTNIQVQAVDEADFVKNDGKYIYMIKDNQILIIDAYPAENAKVISTINIGGNPKSMFVNKDRLVLFLENDEMETVSEYRVVTKTFVLVFDISNRENPLFVKEYNVDGNYFEARMVDNYIYFIARDNVYYNKGIVDVPIFRGLLRKSLVGDKITVTNILSSASRELEKIITPNIYYFNYSEDYYVFNIVVAFNIFNTDFNAKTYMMGDSSNLYMSKDNIYLTYKKQEDETIIHKIHIDKNKINYVANGKVPGHVLNQFSMDEYDNYFRIATTFGEVRDRNILSTNNLYVLDENLKIIGKLEGLAPGEQIHSARFIGKKGYLVTFKKVDPLFVIDLSDPKNPKVLGKLKIPGYSDYLHPYDENHLIGIGKDTIEAESGNFAWYQGIKMALFDVSDVENPIEEDKVIFGKRGSDSEVLRDHKAFLFDKEKNILVLPVDEVKEVEYYHNNKLYTIRNEIWRGAYVFGINPSEGFEYKGKITHSETEEGGYAYTTDETIRRSLYMDDVLYTISGIAIKMNDINVIPDEINTIELK